MTAVGRHPHMLLKEISDYGIASEMTIMKVVNKELHSETPFF